MKYIVALPLALAFVSFSECSVQLPFTEADLDFFAKLKFEQLPRGLQIALRKSGRKGDSSNWCCVEDAPVKNIQRTKSIVDFAKVKASVVTGYRKCSFWGKRCPIYDVRYTTKPFYHVGYYEVPDPTGCTETFLKCCDSYMLVGGTCISVSDLLQHGAELLRLKQGGLFDVVG